MHRILIIVLLAFVFFSCNKNNENEKDEKNTGVFKWKDKLTLADIPETPIKGMLNGSELNIQYINFEQWRGSGDNVINFGDKKPEQTCGYVEGDRAVHLTHKSGEIKPGELVKETFDKNLDGYTADYHFYKGENDISKINVPWNCALVITEMTDKIVKGKIAICFKDDKKSWIAGTFEASRCYN